jgi:hypothetical protein
MPVTAPLRLVVLAAAALTLAGCTSAPGPVASSSAAATSNPAPSSPSDASPTVSASTPAETTGPTSPGSSGTGGAGGSGSCGPSSGRAAAAAGIAKLALPAGLPDATWDAANADYTGYEPCAALSWVTLGIAMSTASSPYAILLFHNGSYLGTATKEAYGFLPDVVRAGDATLKVTYHYPKPGESTADASGTTNVVLTWNASAGKVEFSGETPPAG